MIDSDKASSDPASRFFGRLDNDCSNLTGSLDAKRTGRTLNRNGPTLSSVSRARSLADVAAADAELGAAKTRDLLFTATASRDIARSPVGQFAGLSKGEVVEVLSRAHEPDGHPPTPLVKLVSCLAARADKVGLSG